LRMICINLTKIVTIFSRKRYSVISEIVFYQIQCLANSRH
jgi:hypothetical protein